MLGIFVVNLVFSMEYDDFLWKLRRSNFPVDEILDNRAISRFDTARALNMAICFDCMIPAKSYIDKYSKAWWSSYNSTA